MPNPLPLIIGHRGACAYLPENTLPGFRLAFEKFKVDMIEFDIRMTKDGIPVVIHDSRLNRTTNGHGYVSKKSYRELENLDAGYFFDPHDLEKFPERGKGMKIPAFEEVLTSFPGHSLAVEIKEKSETLTHAVMGLLKKHNMSDKAIVGSKHHLVSQTLRHHYPSQRRFCSEREVFSLYLKFKSRRHGTQKYPTAIASLPIYFMGIHFDQSRWIDFLHAKEIKVFYWAVNHPRLIPLLYQRGADGFVLDDPDQKKLIHPAGGIVPKDA